LGERFKKRSGKRFRKRKSLIKESHKKKGIKSGHRQDKNIRGLQAGKNFLIKRE